ncbi:MAG: flagellar biosynthetic protein FliO [Limnochordia bacterium]
MTGDLHTWWALFKVALLLVGMVLLGRYTPMLLARIPAGTPKRRKHIRLLDSLYLGADRSVHLIEVDGARLVLGITRAGVQLLQQLSGESGTAAVGEDGGEGQADVGDS